MGLGDLDPAGAKLEELAVLDRGDDPLTDPRTWAPRA